ncbi:hypothetical protein CDAR_221441 [Caerostris darwini]|uniref:[histone H3]-lysine(36) N-trimethyltransferase n=1 Tax=Caerostris darwini TaxID=1538125 RepID=A0AAV4WLC4_9ARAC|nr:hypothetical protein CDAR_221441 [Caerostris darwini]
MNQFMDNVTHSSYINSGNLIQLVNQESTMKPEKVKSRWRRNSEREIREKSGLCLNSSEKEAESLNVIGNISVNELQKESLGNIEVADASSIFEKRDNVPTYIALEENVYLFEKKRTKRQKEVRRMLCECTVSKEERENGVLGCQDECLNRLLMIECGSRCATGEACSNKRFQKRLYAKVEPFKTRNKGWGLKVLENVPMGNFVIEYVGEVLSRHEFKQRVKQYAREKSNHYYFMALKSDEILDAANKGNLSRFMNHSCDPNCETQKWTVNGNLRIGFFAKRDIKAGEELTFDYQFQRYGREAQKCYCDSGVCSGFIGVSNEISLDITSKTTNKRKKGPEEKKRDIFEDLILEEEIEKLCDSGGLRNKDETLILLRLMVRAEDFYSRNKLLEVILGTYETGYLRLFLDYHGLSLLWSWMVDLTDSRLKLKILQVLSFLPVPNKTMLLESKVYNVVERWASSILVNEQPHVYLPNSNEIAYEKNFASLTKKVKSSDISDNEADTESLSKESTLCQNEKIMDQNIHTEILQYLEEGSLNSGITSDPEENSAAADKITDVISRSDEESGDTMDLNKLNNVDIFSVANNLLSSWKSLKEDFRIPRRERQKEACKSYAYQEKEAHLYKPYESHGSNFCKYNQVAKDFNYISKEKIKETSPFTQERNRDHRHNDLEEKPRKVLLPTPVVLTKEERRLQFEKEVLKNDQRKALRKQQHFMESVTFSSSMENVLASTNNNYSFNPASENFSNRNSEKHSYNDTENEAVSFKQNYYNQEELQQNRPVLLPTPANAALLPASNTLNPVPLQIVESITSIYSSNVFQTTLPPQVSIRPPAPPAVTRLPPPLINIIRCQNNLLPPPQSNLIHCQNNFRTSTQNNVISCQNNLLPPPPNNLIVNPPPSNLIVNPPPSNSQSNLRPPPPNLIDVANLLKTVPPPIISTVPTVNKEPTAPITNPVVQPSLYNSIPNPVCVPSNNSFSALTLFSQFIPAQNSYAGSQNGGISSQQQITPPSSEQIPVHVNKDKAVKSDFINLPPNWKTAKDSEGNIYYYHTLTRKTQWNPPKLSKHKEDGDDATPTYDEPQHKEKKQTETHKRRSHKKHSKKKSTTTAAADTSSNHVKMEIARKVKELFRTKMSAFVVQCLNPYHRDDCRVGKITSNDDFKHLARKLTHVIMAKELKHCKSVEDLEYKNLQKFRSKSLTKSENLLFTQERIRDYRYIDMEDKPQKVLPTPVVLTKEERQLQFEKKVPKNDQRKALCKQQHFSSSTENALSSTNSHYSFYPANRNSENDSYNDIGNEFVSFKQKYYNQKKLLQNQPVLLHNQKELSQKHTVSLETPDHPVLLHNQKELQQKHPFLLPMPENKNLLPTSNTLNAVPLPRVESNTPIYSTNVLQTTLPPQVPDRPLSTPVPSLSSRLISIRHDNLLAPSPTGIIYQSNLLSQPPTNSIVNSPPTILPLFSQFIPGQNSYAGSQNGSLPSQQRFMHPASGQISAQANKDATVKSDFINLPPNWKWAKDSKGRIYYYHTLTRETRWNPPKLSKHKEDGDDAAPTYDEPQHKEKKQTETHKRRSHKKHSRKKSTNTAATSSNCVKTKTSGLTHTIIKIKLMKYVSNEDLKCNESKDFKVRDYIRKYMANYGPVYKRE